MTAPPTPATYWDYDPRTPLTCPRCGWSGTTVAEDTQAFLDVRCPACDGPILKVSWPSADETRAAAERGDERARCELRSIGAVKRRQATARRIELRDPAQLPVLDDDRIDVVWDQVDADGETWTVLRVGDREVFRELAFWEGVDRFVEVVDVLRRAYGRRLRSVTPTDRSTQYLWGDRLGAPGIVEGVDADLRRER